MIEGERSCNDFHRLIIIRKGNWTCTRRAPSYHARERGVEKAHRIDVGAPEVVVVDGNYKLFKQS